MKNARKELKGKCTQKPFDHAKKSATDALKTAWRRPSRKTAKATNDLTGNKIADKIKNTASWLNPENNSQTDENSIEIPKERHIHIIQGDIFLLNQWYFESYESSTDCYK